MTVRVDVSKLDANIARYTDRIRREGVALRAHVKGHRVPEISASQVAAGAVGVSVHSAAEALAHARAGARDVVVAWSWRDSWRWPLFAALAREFKVAVHVDDPIVVHDISAAAVNASVELGVRVEVDTGLHRTGVPPEKAVALAKAIDAAPSLRLDGVTGYAAITSAEQAERRFDYGREQASLLVDVAGELSRAGLPCPNVSVGGTPTLTGALSVSGVTEVCCGAYALLDAGLAAIGECELDEVAITVDGEDVELLAGGDQVWQPGVVMARTDSGAILPAHVCPLVAKRPLVNSWQALVQPDRP